MLIDGHWLAVKRTDERAYALYARHYLSCEERALAATRQLQRHVRG
jgi:hypothetical protein